MAKAKTICYVPGNNPFSERGNDGFLISNINLGYADQPRTVGSDEYDGCKHEVYMPRPRVADHDSIESLSAECQSFFGEQANLQALIDQAIVNLFTHVNFKAGIADKPTEEEKHEAAIDLAANYQMGRKSVPGASVKAKAAKLNSMEKEAAELGLSMDDILALAKQMKESGQI